MVVTVSSPWSVLTSRIIDGCSALCEMSDSRDYCGGVVVRGKVYVVGGKDFDYWGEEIVDLINVFIIVIEFDYLNIVSFNHYL